MVPIKSNDKTEDSGFSQAGLWVNILLVKLPKGLPLSRCQLTWPGTLCGWLHHRWLCPLLHERLWGLKVT